MGISLRRARKLKRKVAAYKKLSKVKRVPKFNTSTKRKKIPGTSKSEAIFGKFLRTECGLKIERQFELNYKFYDFKIKDENILIEFDGDYYHFNENKQSYESTNQMQKNSIVNDELKNAIAKSNGYKLIRIWESDFKQNKHLVKKRILNIIKEFK